MAYGARGHGETSLAPGRHREDASRPRHTNAFVATLIVFFAAEIGDQTQIATVALAAGYSNLIVVVAGTTTGLLLANAPVAFLGKTFSERIPLKAIHYVASGVFAILGAAFLLRAFHPAK